MRHMLLPDAAHLVQQLAGADWVGSAITAAQPNDRPEDDRDDDEFEVGADHVSVPFLSMPIAPRALPTMSLIKSRIWSPSSSISE